MFGVGHTPFIEILHVKGSILSKWNTKYFRDGAFRMELGPYMFELNKEPFLGCFTSKLVTILL